MKILFYSVSLTAEYTVYIIPISSANYIIDDKHNCVLKGKVGANNCNNDVNIFLRVKEFSKGIFKAVNATIVVFI